MIGALVAVVVSVTAAAPFSRLEPVAAEATSELADPMNFAAPYAVDDDVTTAWVEGKQDDGKGEVLTLKLTPVKGATHLKLVIRNGYQKSEVLLQQNAAPKALHVKLSAGGAVAGEQDWALERKMGPQELTIAVKPGAAVDAVAVRIDDVHKGSKYADTCISDIQVFVDAAVDSAVQSKNRTALEDWRAKRSLSKSDFIAARFVDADAPAQGKAPACFGDDVADAVKKLQAFLDSSEEGGGRYVASPGVVWPAGYSGAAGAFTRIEVGHQKALKGGGRHRRSGGCSSCGSDAYLEDIDLFVEDGRSAHAFVGRHTENLADVEQFDSGRVFVLDNRGHVLLDVGMRQLSMSPANLELRVARYHWSSAGKIDRVTVVNEDCGRTLYQPAP